MINDNENISIVLFHRNWKKHVERNGLNSSIMSKVDHQRLRNCKKNASLPYETTNKFGRLKIGALYFSAHDRKLTKTV